MGGYTPIQINHADPTRKSTTTTIRGRSSMLAATGPRSTHDGGSCGYGCGLGVDTRHPRPPSGPTSRGAETREGGASVADCIRGKEARPEIDVAILPSCRCGGSCCRTVEEARKRPPLFTTRSAADGRGRLSAMVSMESALCRRGIRAPRG
jgi:hypothetical protein